MGGFWANEHLPQFVEKEDRMQRLHYAKHREHAVK